MSGELVKQEPQAVAVSESVNFIQMIERAARDPAVDIDKMERLMQMHERMVNRQAESEFNDALVACQREFGTISADATNPQTRSRYATYARLDKKLRPIYTAHGITISYGTEDSPKPEHVRVIAYVSRKGYTRIYRTDMPADGKGAKGGDVMTKTHATGAAMSYGARYLLKGIFNVSIGEDDDDGNGAGNVGVMPAKKNTFLDAIAAAADVAALQAVWQSIAQACRDANDLAFHEEAKTAVNGRKKVLTTTEETI